MHMSRLAVLPAYRGQAIGRRLMEWAEQEAHRLGVLHLRGEVRSVLHRLLEWYKALGYQATGTRTLSGVPHCITIIEKWLDEQPAGARVEPDLADEPVWLEETPVAWELLHPALAELPGLRAHPVSRDSRGGPPAQTGAHTARRRTLAHQTAGAAASPSRQSLSTA